MIDFSGQTVVVTGAGGNLGRAAATLLARLGADLVLADQRDDAIEAVSRDLGAARVAAIAGQDVRTRGGAQAVAERALSAFGRIDALVNTVGSFQVAPVAAGAADQWSFLMDLNARSALLLCEAVLPAMVERRYGRIVHVAAGAGLKSFSGGAAYAASKAALMRVAEAVAEEHKQHGVTANCVLPSIIDTPQNRAAMPDADHARWTPPEEIAAVMAFLASRSASAVTGAAIPVPGRQ